jgi:hypothetical protein
VAVVHLIKHIATRSAANCGIMPTCRFVRPSNEAAADIVIAARCDTQKARAQSEAARVNDLSFAFAEEADRARGSVEGGFAF